MSICHEADLSILFPRVAAALGAAYTLGGRVADAVPLLIQAMERTTAMNMRGLQALCSIPLGEAYMLAGCLEEAQALTDRELTLARPHQERGQQAYALRLLGDIAMYRDPPKIDQAETSYQQALSLSNELSMRPLQAHCYHGLGRLYSQAGQAEQAYTELSMAIQMYRDMEMLFWLPKAEATLTAI
jgi:tetratricopeptide (TPR) repeat protein